jgi:hypothetical protein
MEQGLTKEELKPNLYSDNISAWVAVAIYTVLFFIIFYHDGFSAMFAGLWFIPINIGYAIFLSSAKIPTRSKIYFSLFLIALHVFAIFSSPAGFLVGLYSIPLFAPVIVGLVKGSKEIN